MKQEYWKETVFSMKKWENAISNKESKQHCTIEKRILKNETSLLKGNSVTLKCARMQAVRNKANNIWSSK